jgi:hypothetical protein
LKIEKLPNLFGLISLKLAQALFFFLSIFFLCYRPSFSFPGPLPLLFSSSIPTQPPLTKPNSSPLPNLADPGAIPTPLTDLTRPANQNRHQDCLHRSCPHRRVPDHRATRAALGDSLPLKPFSFPTRQLLQTHLLRGVTEEPKQWKEFSQPKPTNLHRIGIKL